MGNRGVTKVGVVERGKLQGYEALERSKRLRQQALQGAGWGRGWRVIIEKRLNHNPRVGGSSPSSATTVIIQFSSFDASPFGTRKRALGCPRH